MISIRESITTAKPREEAFAYVADFTTVAEWDPGIAGSERTGGDGGVGTTYRVVATFRGREVPMTYEVMEYDRPERIVLRGEGAAVHAVDTIEFSVHDGGTRIDYSADFRMKGLLRFAEPFIGGMFRDLGRKAITGLEQSLQGS